MDSTQFQLTELHSRFNMMKISLQCTSNNLNDLNMNYNYQSATLSEKINQIELLLNSYILENNLSQCNPIALLLAV